MATSNEVKFNYHRDNKNSGKEKNVWNVEKKSSGRIG